MGWMAVMLMGVVVVVVVVLLLMLNVTAMYAADCR